VGRTCYEPLASTHPDTQGNNAANFPANDSSTSTATGIAQLWNPKTYKYRLFAYASLGPAIQRVESRPCEIRPQGAAWCLSLDGVRRRVVCGTGGTSPVFVSGSFTRVCECPYRLPWGYEGAEAVGETRPSAPGDPGRSAPAGRKGIVPTRAKTSPPLRKATRSSSCPSARRWPIGQLPNPRVTYAGRARHRPIGQESGPVHRAVGPSLVQMSPAEGPERHSGDLFVGVQPGGVSMRQSAVRNRDVWSTTKNGVAISVL